MFVVIFIYIYFEEKKKYSLKCFKYNKIVTIYKIWLKQSKITNNAKTWFIFI